MNSLTHILSDCTADVIHTVGPKDRNCAQLKSY